MEEKAKISLADRLLEVRTAIKDLKKEEDKLKELVLATGLTEIKGENAKITITERSSETFLEEAFIETFSKDEKFDDALKAQVLESKVVVNQANLMELVSKGEIELDYVKPFAEIKTSKVINVK